MSLNRVLDNFYKISKIPHCSYKADRLKEYILNFATEYGYDTKVDNAGNILVSKGKSKLSLQSHYDMVCVGKAPEIEIIEDGEWIEAKESSLGADNGIGVAMMLTLIQEGKELEFLFTADEEVGLIGAKELNFKLNSKYMLNLDTEEDGAVYIGCAGGVDLRCKKECKVVENSQNSWRVSVSNLPGGHSGVDIDKGIPNAIKVLAQYLFDKECSLVSFKGGERRNSIPANAIAIVKSDTQLPPADGIEIEPLGKSSDNVLEDSDGVLAMLATLPNGVVDMNEDLNIPDRSLNLAIVKIEDGDCEIEYSLRAMSDEGLNSLVIQMKTILQRYGFDVKEEDYYPAWKPEISTFVERVAQIEKEIFGKVEIKAIHAGLECGILSKKYPEIEMASIGPEIENPHSIRERVNKSSIGKSYDVLEKVVSNYQ